MLWPLRRALRPPDARRAVLQHVALCCNTSRGVATRRAVLQRCMLRCEAESDARLSDDKLVPSRLLRRLQRASAAESVGNREPTDTVATLRNRLQYGAARAFLMSAADDMTGFDASFSLLSSAAAAALGAAAAVAEAGAGWAVPGAGWDLFSSLISAILWR